MRKMFKWALSAFLSLLMLFSVCSVNAENPAWDCPECGRKGNTGNYCGSCGHPAPWIYSVTSTPKPVFTSTPRKATATPRPTATPKETTATPRPTATPRKPTATPKPVSIRDFSINPNVKYEKGRVTIKWNDSENKSPYAVSYQYTGSNVNQPRYWAGGNEKESTTYSKSFTLTDLIPGKEYRIEVKDNTGTSPFIYYTVPKPTDFVDGRLKASSIKVTITPRQTNGSTGTIISSLRASDIIKNRGQKEYGFRYSIEYPQLAYSRNYFTQIAITAPNGYLECEVCSDIEYASTYSSYYWTVLGNWTFNMIYDKNSVVPTGEWKVDLYWDGMHVDRSYFYVE